MTTAPDMTAVGAQIGAMTTELKLPTVRRLYRRVARDVAAHGGDYEAYLLAVLREEVTERNCLATPIDWRRTGPNCESAQAVDHAASTCSSSSLLLTSRAHGCHRGNCVRRPSTYTSAGTKGSPPSSGVSAQCGRS